MADSENNLDLLSDHPSDHFVHKMWLNILDDPDMCPLSYVGSLQTLLQRAELTEISLPKHAAGDAFNCRLPFSWIIKQSIDEILNNVKKRRDLGIHFDHCNKYADDFFTL